MIQQESRLDVADNNDARGVLCIHVLGGTHRRYASVGDIIVMTAKSVILPSDMKKNTVAKTLIVKTEKEIRHINGSYVCFDDNAYVLLAPNRKLHGTRISGPIAHELHTINMKVVSLAPEVF